MDPSGVLWLADPKSDYCILILVCLGILTNQIVPDDSMCSFWVEANLCRVKSFIYMYCCWGFSCREGGWDPISQLHPAYLCACLRRGTGIPPWYIVVVFIYVRWVQVRGESSFCWYWWNCWPSMFKLSYHNTRNNSIKSIIWRIVWDFIFWKCINSKTLLEN